MKVATIGTGGIAERHLEVLSREPDVEIVGHVTPHSQRAEEAAARWGGRAYRDYRALLNAEVVEAAWICVPPGEHGAIEHALIGAGIPFFVEKPLDADCWTAEGIASALRQSGLIAGVGYHWRAMDTIPEVQRTLSQNPPRMVIGEWLDATPPPTWWRHQMNSGGQMVEQATHLVDLSRLFLGEAAVVAAQADRHPRSAYPDADVADTTAALLLYGEGVSGVFTATCLLAGPSAIRLRLVCEGVIITVTQEAVVYDTGCDSRTIPTGNDPFAAEDRAFLAAVRQRDPRLLFSSYEDALHTHRLCCAIRHAAGDDRSSG